MFAEAIKFETAAIVATNLKLLQSLDAVLAETNALVIIDDATAKHAGELLLTVKAAIKDVEAAWSEPVSAAHAVHKKLTAARAEQLAPLTSAEVRLKRCIVDWQAKVEAARREKERLLRVEAERLERERRIAEAAALAAAGQDKAADSVMAAPVIPIAVHIPPPAKIEGVSTSVKWRFRVVNAAEIPREYLMPDEQKIGAVVSAMGKETKISGIEVYPETIVSGRVR